MVPNHPPKQAAVPAGHVFFVFSHFPFASASRAKIPGGQPLVVIFCPPPKWSNVCP